MGRSQLLSSFHPLDIHIDSLTTTEHWYDAMHHPSLSKEPCGKIGVTSQAHKLRENLPVSCLMLVLNTVRPGSTAELNCM